MAERESMILVSCNRNDFLRLAKEKPHAGIIIVVRRRTRAAECAAVLRLLRDADSSGIRENVNFA